MNSTMTFDEYRSHDALGLAELSCQGTVSAAEVMAAAVQRLEAVNPTINAVTYLHAAALSVGAISAPTHGPFAGVPYLIKDLHAPVQGMPLTHGSRLFAGQVHDVDSETVARLRRAGFVLIGRSNAPEFGMNVSTEPRAFGATRNPWNLAHSAGGSSGGAAAAGGRRHRSCRPRHRQWRLDPHPGVLHRPGRTQADTGPAGVWPAAGRRRPWHQPRTCADAVGTRLCGHPGRHRRAGHRGALLHTTPGCAVPGHHRA